MDIKPIETVYKGYRFRSRLEARWAVFFDAFCIKWEYEPEGFETALGRYLPDFWLPKFNYGEGTWIEVKPSGFLEGNDRWDVKNKLSEVCDKTNSCGMILDGVPDCIMYPFYDGTEETYGYGRYWVYAIFSSSYIVGGHENEYRCFIEHVECREDWGSRLSSDVEPVHAARSARFEFGENGAR